MISSPRRRSPTSTSAWTRRRATPISPSTTSRRGEAPDQQQLVLDALRFKCDVLWAQLDALEHAYVTPGSIPQGAFRPEVA